MSCIGRALKSKNSRVKPDKQNAKNDIYGLISPVNISSFQKQLIKPLISVSSVSVSSVNNDHFVT